MDSPVSTKMALPTGLVPVIEHEPFTKAEQMGEFRAYPSHHILVAPGLAGDAWRRTVLHECIHAIDDAYGLGLSESKTRVLETALFSFIQDNPDFILGILENDPQPVPTPREEP